MNKLWMFILQIFSRWCCNSHRNSVVSILVEALNLTNFQEGLGTVVVGLSSKDSKTLFRVGKRNRIRDMGMWFLFDLNSPSRDKHLKGQCSGMCTLDFISIQKTFIWIVLGMREKSKKKKMQPPN